LEQNFVKVGPNCNAPLSILPKKGSINQDQKTCGKHQNADSIDSVHHSQVEIAGLVSPFGFKDFHKVV